MRQIDPALQAKLNTGATTLCRCWLVVRTDGVTFGFTDHDEDIVFDGHVFAAGTGLDAASLESSTGLSVDNTQAVGALSAIGLTEEDIQSGRFDDAEVWQWLVDWQDSALRVLLFRGFLGEIKRAGPAFEVELRGLSETLNQPIGRSYTKGCDRILGDAKCGVNVNSSIYRTTATVAEVVDNRIMRMSNQPSYAPGWFTHGTLVWTSGQNAGSKSVIKSDSTKGSLRFVETWSEAARSVVPGDAFSIVAGCDKQMNTCSSKFQNLNNFRGFPDMPGEDWAAAYPSSSAQHDGRSRRNG